MSKEALDNLLAFSIGDLVATVSLFIMNVKFIALAETIGLKMAVIVLSGFIGGFAGVLGKYVAQRFVIDKYFKVILVCFPLGALMTGCAPKVAGVITHAATESRDSTSVQVIERFVPVYLPGDTVVFEHQIECPEWDLPKADGSTSLTMTKTTPKPFKAQVSGKRSDGVIEVNDIGRLMAVFSCKPLEDSIKVRDTEIARLKSVSKSDNTTVTIYVKYVPKIYKAAMWFSWIVIALIALWAGLKAVKFYYKIQVPFI